MSDSCHGTSNHSTMLKSRAQTIGEKEVAAKIQNIMSKESNIDLCFDNFYLEMSKEEYTAEAMYEKIILICGRGAELQIRHPELRAQLISCFSLKTLKKEQFLNVIHGETNDFRGFMMWYKLTVTEHNPKFEVKIALFSVDMKKEWWYIKSKQTDILKCVMDHVKDVSPLTLME